MVAGEGACATFVRQTLSRYCGYLFVGSTSGLIGAGAGYGLTYEENRPLAMAMAAPFAAVMGVMILRTCVQVWERRLGH